MSLSNLSCVLSCIFYIDPFAVDYLWKICFIGYAKLGARIAFQLGCNLLRKWLQLVSLWISHSSSCGLMSFAPCIFQSLARIVRQYLVGNSSDSLFHQHHTNNIREVQIHYSAIMNLQSCRTTGSLSYKLNTAYSLFHKHIYSPMHLWA